MGLAKKCNVAIFFTNEEKIETADYLKKELEEFFLNENPEKNKPYIDITQFNSVLGYCEFTLYSDRSKNLDFQVELLENYLTKKYGDAVDEVTLDSWIKAEYP